MTINFPGSLDNFTNPTSSSPINSPSHADQHANANDAIEALEAKVGVDGSTVVTSHDYKIAQLQSLVTSAVAGAKSIYQDVRNQSGSAFTKATPVYVSGSTGASGQLLVSAASNATEATSSKTMGITTSAISNNSNGQVISEGILEGIDTTGAADGDPVWLGVNGAKIYGLVNKPSAPAHLVFLGIVIRGGQANTGSMYVKIQNGFELQEIHNVEISSLVNGNILAYDSTTQTWKNTNTIQSTSSTTPLVVKGASSPSVNIFEVQNSGGYPMVYVDAYGALKAQASGMYVNSGYASGTGLVVRGYTSQTADLQQWQNSAGTVLAAVSNIGTIRSSIFANLTGGLTYIATNFDTGGIGIVTSSAAQKGLIIRGSASQTANLQEWQDSTGSLVGRIEFNGKFVTAANIVSLASIHSWNIITLGTNEASYSSATISASTRNAANPGLVIRGVASQTANLQEWQNSAGTILASVDSYGNMVSQALSTGITRVSFAGLYGASLNVIPYGTAQQGIIVRAVASQTADLQQWQDSSGTVISKISKDGQFYGYGSQYGGSQYGSIGALGLAVGGQSGETSIHYAGGSLTVRSSTTGDMSSGSAWTNNTSALIGTGYAGGIGLIIKSVASQTADLQQWQNSAGTVLSSITASGDLNFNSTLWNIKKSGTNVIQWQPSTGSTFLSYGSSNIPITVQGSSGQTGNLTEWKNNSGTVLARIQSDGALVSDYITSGIYLTSLGKLRAGSASNYGGQLEVTTTAAGNIGAVIRRVTSQTADLMQWQDQSGGILGTINKDGAITLNSSTSLGAALSAYTSWSGATGIIVKGSTSQTANLQEWQNSAGTALASVSATGTIYAYETANSDALNIYQGSGARRLVFGLGGLSTTSTFTSGSISWSGVAQTEINSGTASRVGLLVKGAASQTANLQQWQDSSGIVLGSIASDGTTTLGYQYLTSGTHKIYGITQILNNASGISSLSVLNPAWSGSSSFTMGTTGTDNVNNRNWQFVVGGGAYAGQSGNYIGEGGLILFENNPNDSSATFRAGFRRGGQFALNSTQETYSANLSIKPISTSTAGIVIRANSSQTANLQEWQDSSGNILSRIGNNGTFFWGGNSYLSASLGTALIGNNYASDVALKVKSAASQTANLQEWQNSAGTVLSYVRNDGLIYSPYLQGNRIFAYAINSDWANYSMTSTASSATSVPLGIRGAASQTANLQEWQNSAGTLLSNINSIGLNEWRDSSGNYRFGLKYSADRNIIDVNSTNSGLVFGWSPNYIGGYGTDQGAGNTWWFSPYASDRVGVIIRGKDSQTANLQEWQTNTGQVNAYISSSGYFTNFMGIIADNINSGSTSLTVKTTYANVKPMIVQGAASQSANLTEWQNSTGSVISSISSTGLATFANLGVTSNIYAYYGKISANTQALGHLGQISAVTANASTIGLVIRGSASQTANLQEWQDSAGTVLSRIASNGRMVISSDTEASSGMLTISQAAASAIVLSTTSTANDYGLALNATGSGNNTSIGISFSAFTTNGYNGVATPGGAIWFTRSGSYSLGYLSFLTRSGTGANDPLTERMRIGDTGTVSISGFTASSQGLIVKGASSQTASLQEWQNSSGVMVAKIDASGNGTFGQASFAGGAATIDGGGGAALGAIYTGSLRNAGTSYNFFSNVTGSPYATVVVKQLSGQTTNLQEWQNSSGTAMASIDSGGGLVIGRSSGIGSALITLQGTTAQTFYSTDNTAALNSRIIFVRGNTTGTIMSITSKGDTAQGVAALVISDGAFTKEITGFGYNGNIYTNIQSATTVGLTIKGAASQTADLQQWQDSNGNVVSSIRSNGGISLNYANKIRLYNTANTDYASLWMDNGSGGTNLYTKLNYPLLIGNMSVDTGAWLTVASSSASAIPLIIQHASSPTSSYFEIRNSTGNPVWGINLAGEALTRTTTKYGANIQNDSSNNYNALYIQGDGSGNGIPLYVKLWSGTKDIVKFDNGGVVKLSITSDGSLKGGNSNTVSINTASTVDTVALSSFTSMEYTLSIKQGSKIRSSKVLVHTDGTSVDSTEYGIMEMGGGISGILVTASVSGTDAILQVTITDAATTNATVKLIKTML